MLFSVLPSSPVLKRQRERVEAVHSLRSFFPWIFIGARLGKKLGEGYGTTPIYQICEVIVDSTLLWFSSAWINNELACTQGNGNPKWEHIRMVNHNSWQLPSFAQAPAAPPSKLCPSRSRHQKPLGLIIGLSNRRSLNMYKLKHTSMALLQNFLFQVKSLLLTRELD